MGASVARAGVRGAGAVLGALLAGLAQHPGGVVRHLRDELFPVCESPRAYKFTIRFRGWETNISAFIESLLQIPQIGRCPNVALKLSGLYNIQLPVEAIAQWLHQQSSGTKRITDQKRREKFLTIELNNIDTPNLLEISAHLTKVFLTLFNLKK